MACDAGVLHLPLPSDSDPDQKDQKEDITNIKTPSKNGGKSVGNVYNDGKHEGVSIDFAKLDKNVSAIVFACHTKGDTPSLRALNKRQTAEVRIDHPHTQWNILVPSTEDDSVILCAIYKRVVANFGNVWFLRFVMEGKAGMDLDVETGGQLSKVFSIQPDVDNVVYLYKILLIHALLGLFPGISRIRDKFSLL